MKFNSQNGYKASIYKNGVQMNSKKDFFPDEWNEEKVIDAIKGAYNNPTAGTLPWSLNFIGETSNGLRIFISKKTNGTIKSAYPN